MSPRIAYKTFNFRDATMAVIDRANAILLEYERQGYELTLRQLYYQFVARGLIPNNDREYKKLGDVVNNGRLAGEIDWNHITDRTRYVRVSTSWSDPADIIANAASGYAIDVWEGQPEYVEVWVEKDALVGVVERACRDLRLPFLSCRGYMSQSEMWSAARRLGRIIAEGRRVTLLHLGDHDPSGIDMSRDIKDRITDFLYGDGVDATAFDLHRIALTMEQVEQYEPPPNPAKITDSRSDGYIARYGGESWELDALEPSVLDELISTHARMLVDRTLMDYHLAREEKERETLTACSDRWPEVVDLLETL